MSFSKNKKISIILLLFILFIATFFRLFSLGKVPPSPDWDEASLGYNAYSIMLTGKDEYGKTFPLILRSFDDYKPGLYAYFIIPFIKLFGLSTFSVRLPSVLFGIGTVFITYFLVLELFKKSHFSDKISASHIALLASFFLAISPWHIQFSRIAFESNVGVFFNAAVILFFLKGLKDHKYLVVSSLMAGLNLYIYQSEKVFTPILVVLLIVLFWKSLISIPKKYLVFSALIGFLVVLPLLQYLTTDKKALARAQGVSIFADQTKILKTNSQRLIIDAKNHDLLGKILDNRRVFFAKEVLNGYLSHFDLNWLFINGDLARHHAPFVGLMYLWEIPLLLIGIYSLFFGAFERKTKIFIFLWILIVPIPASITSGVPHAVRTLNFLPALQIVTAIGLLFVLKKISNLNVLSYLAYLIFIIFSIFNFLYYLDQYFVQQNYFYSSEWQYGYKETIEQVKKIEGKYKKIIVSNQPHLDQSYIFFLFYLNYPPRAYQEETGNRSGGFAEEHRFGKFEFRPIIWEEELKNNNILYIGRPDDFPQGARILKTINFLNTQPAIKIVEL